MTAATSVATGTNQRPPRADLAPSLCCARGLHSVARNTAPRKTCFRVQGFCSSAVMKREFVQPRARQNSEFTPPIPTFSGLLSVSHLFFIVYNNSLSSLNLILFWRFFSCFSLNSLASISPLFLPHTPPVSFSRCLSLSLLSDLSSSFDSPVDHVSPNRSLKACHEADSFELAKSRVGASNI